MTIRAIVQDRRIVVPAPSDLPDGTEVVLTIAPDRPDDDDGPMSPEEIARVLAAMKEFQPWDIPQDVAAELDEWERKINEYGIAHAEDGLEDVFR
jgi:hypothetical protein